MRVLYRVLVNMNGLVPGPIPSLGMRLQSTVREYGHYCIAENFQVNLIFAFFTDKLLSMQKITTILYIMGMIAWDRETL